MGYHAIPFSQRDAKAFINAYHRHHKASVGDIFRVAIATDCGDIVGVAQAGRPVARGLNDGVTIEVTRLCIRDDANVRNAASFLYSRCIRIAREMGYQRIVTYTLASEGGSSLRACGFTATDTVCGRSWDCPSRHRGDTAPTCDKVRWEVQC